MFFAALFITIITIVFALGALIVETYLIAKDIQKGRYERR